MSLQIGVVLADIGHEVSQIDCMEYLEQKEQKICQSDTKHSVQSSLRLTFSAEKYK